MRLNFEIKNRDTKLNWGLRNEKFNTNIMFTTSKKKKWTSTYPVSFTSSELGEVSSFNSCDHNNGVPILIYIRPTTPTRTRMSVWSEKFPEQTATNKEGEIVPLKEFDIFDMLNGFMDSKELHLLMEKEKSKKK